MAAVTFDGQSFTVDGRRIWLVSGTLYPARIPKALWRQRLRAARQAGLNCILTPVFWNVHEPQPGVFRFDAEADLKAFVRLLQEEGMWCILRPGPYVGGGWDMGGLPAWLLENGGMKLRQADPRFLQAVARYFEAVFDELRDLQVTASRPGPILTVQVEHEWLCANDAQAESYLGQLVRFLRESGCQVPLINTNNLWQQVPGTLDGWNGSDHLLTNCRQLRVLRGDAPVIVTGLTTGEPRTWGKDHPPEVTPGDLLRRIAEATAAGAMVNLDPICGGTNFGFRGGRLLGDDDRFVATSFDSDAPIGESGECGEKYAHIKRLCPFLSSFQPLLASLHPAEHHTVATTGVSVIQQTGPQGKVVFILRDEADKTQSIELSTPDGQTLPVWMGQERVAWLLLNAKLDGVGRLDLTNLRPWALVGKRMLVLFGPAGTSGILSIDGTLHTTTVPNGSDPKIFKHDDLTIVVLNTQTLDATVADRNLLYVGVLGVDADGQPQKHPDFATCCVVDLAGGIKKLKPPAAPKATAPRTGKWDIAGLHAYAAGTAPRFATLSGPRSLEACGADYGYGWYRVRLNRKKSGKANLMLPQSAHRLHVYLDGKLQGVLGVGPGATHEPLPLSLEKDAELVVLADNLGRFSEGLALDWPTGIYGPVLDVKALKLSKPAVSLEPRVDVFELSGFVPRCGVDDRGPYPRYTYSVNLATREPLVLTLRGHRPRSVVLLNGSPVGIDLDHHVTTTLTLTDVRKGVNKITLAQIEPAGERDADPARCCKLYQAAEVLSDGAAWWYARWQVPELLSFSHTGKTGDAPAFFRTTFTLNGATLPPLFAEFTAGAKGQLFLNGENVGRYFVAEARGKKLGAQKRYYLPEPWLKRGENELIVFDEHGKPPAVKLTF